MRTPLAWKNLTSSLGKCTLASTGVGFAVVLMFMQIGFRNALIDNNVQLFSMFDTEVLNVAIVSRARYNISTEQRFPRSFLEQAAAFPGVVDTCAVSVERGTASVKIEGFTSRPIRVIAVELRNPKFFTNPDLHQRLVEADRRNGALVDTRSKSSFGFASDLAALAKQRIELNNREISVLGQFQLGTDFGNDGTLLMSERLHGDYFPWRSQTRNPADVVDIALLQVDSHDPAELDRLAQRIENLRQNPSTFAARRSSLHARKSSGEKQHLSGRFS